MNETTIDTIVVGALKVRPYDSSSKLAHENPGFEHFDSRSDFIAFASQRALAVDIPILNSNALLEEPCGQTARLDVALVDTTDDSIAARTTAARDITADEGVVELRADIPLDEVTTVDARPYLVRVADADTGCTLGEKPVRFYSMSRLRKLPTKWYSPVCAYVESDGRQMRSAGCGAATTVTFEVEPQIALGRAADLPETEIRIVSPTGKDTTCIVKLAGDTGAPLRASIAIDPDETGTYYAELRCMTYPFAGFAFSTQATLEGRWEDDELSHIAGYTPKLGAARIDAAVKEAKKPAPSLDSLTGLAEVKEKVRAYTRFAQFNAKRSRLGLPTVATPLHAMFLGSPGTGKTTVAKILGQELKQAGALSSGHVVVRERATLIGQYYSSESEKTLSALEEAKGGILLIDEAYQLYQPDDPKDPGRFVIETLLTALADESDRDWMLILAGYPEPMRRMFEMNPGLRSRIPQSNVYTFADYSASELMEIALRRLERDRFTLLPEAATALQAHLAAACSRRGDDFGNARYVANLIQCDILPAMARRVATIEQPTVADLSEIHAADIPRPHAADASPRQRIGFCSLAG